MLVGQGNKFELWDENSWKEKCDQWLGDDDDVELAAELESLSLLNLPGEWMQTTSGPQKHVPVLLEAVLAGLAIKPEGVYIDGTFGRGGHSRAILQALGDRGRLLAIDRDPQASCRGGSRPARRFAV